MKEQDSTAGKGATFLIGRSAEIDPLQAVIRCGQLYLPNRGCTALVPSDDWATLVGLLAFAKSDKDPQ